MMNSAVLALKGGGDEEEEEEEVEVGGGRLRVMTRWVRRRGSEIGEGAEWKVGTDNP